MDFHSLTRKELQALCKKNKIPANITNVAMADALAALETVEGLEELLNQSPAMPRTVTRTSTRRKPIKEEPETAQPTTRTRGRTRRAMDQDLDQENKNVNMVETPAMPASRRRAPAAETPAVQTGYSTRRSVRLLEKSLAELSLKEAVKMDVLLDEAEENDVSGNLENTNDSSSSEVLLESEKELEDEVQENDDMVTQDSSHLGNVSGLYSKDDSSTESSDQLDKTGPVDAPVAVCHEISAKDHKKVDESDDDDCVLVSESLSETENASAEVMETENVPDDISTKVVAAAEVHLEEEDLELPFDSDSWETDSNQSVNESNAVNVFSSYATVDNNDSDFQKSVIGKDAEEVVKESFVFDNVQASNGSENLQVEMEESSASGLVDVNLTEGDSPKFAKQTSPTCPPPSEIELISEDVESKKDMIDDVCVMPLPSQEYDFAANLPPLPDTPPSGEKMSPCLSKIPQMSPLGADTIATEFPRPTQLTPVRSSSKKQTTDQKLTLLLTDNKENIDNSGMKVEPKKDKVKKKKNIIDVDGLNEKSLRELTKMFKEKVEIHNKKKNIDEEQFPTKQAQVGKARPALQTLAENVMLPEM